MYKKRFVRPNSNRLGEIMKGLRRKCICHLPLSALKNEKTDRGSGRDVKNHCKIM